MINRRYMPILNIMLIALFVAGKYLSQRMIEWEISCIFMQYGLQCPACGGTHCLYYLTQGYVTRAFWENPYIFCTICICIIIIIIFDAVSLCRKQKGYDLLKRIFTPKWLIVWAVGFAVFGMLRNLPAFLK